ncbi:MAG: diacylglycerol kinase family protein [Intestinibacter sp.]
MKKVKFIYNPNSGDKRIKNEIDTIIQIYQAYDYCVVPYRLTKTRPNEDAFWDIDDNYDHVLSGGDGTRFAYKYNKKETDIQNTTLNQMTLQCYKLPIMMLKSVLKK